MSTTTQISLRLLGRTGSRPLPTASKNIVTASIWYQRPAAKTKRRWLSKVQATTASDYDDDLQLTEEELRLIDLDPIESDDSKRSSEDSPYTVNYEEYKKSLTPEQLNSFYEDRKQFINQEDLERSRRFGIAMANVAAETKCQSIRLLAVHTQVAWTELFLLVTAMSRTQLRAVLGKMEKVALEDWGLPVLEAVTRRSEWECIDFGDLIIHAFSPRTRSHYDLDGMYGDCEEIEIPNLAPVEQDEWQRNLKL